MFYNHRLYKLPIKIYDIFTHNFYYRMTVKCNLFAMYFIASKCTLIGCEVVIHYALIYRQTLRTHSQPASIVLFIKTKILKSPYYDLSYLSQFS